MEKDPGYMLSNNEALEHAYNLLHREERIVSTPVREGGTGVRVPVLGFV